MSPNTEETGSPNEGSSARPGSLFVIPRTLPPEFPAPELPPRTDRRPQMYLSLDATRSAVHKKELSDDYKEIEARSGILEIGPDRYEEIKITDLQVQAHLGSGNYGVVTKRVLNNRCFAVKEMIKTNNEQENRRMFTDLKILCESNNCPYIVKSYGYIIDPNHIYICMEMMAMCLEKLYKEHLMPKNIFIPEEILGQVTISVVRALKYLKDKHNIIHRDVKPSNILIDWNGNVKLCDFGIAGKLIDSFASTTSMGCAAYLSPERLQGGRRYDVRADIWALGISLIELATSQYPYKFDSPFMVMVSITEHPAPRLPESFSPEMRYFVDICLQKDFEMRPKYNDLVKMEWYRKNEETSVDVEMWLKESIASDNEEE